MEINLTLTAMAHKGDALARLPDGRACFVPFGLPGEVVRVRIVDEKKRFARAELLEVLTPAKQRIQPRCIHFGVCGGCQYQHMPYENQLIIKADQLRETLERLGGVENPPVEPTIASYPPWNYRNDIQFYLTDEGALGFHTAFEGDVFTVEECHLPEPSINAIWPLIDLEALHNIRQIGLRAGSDEDVVMTIEGTDPDPPDFSVDLPLSAVHFGPDGMFVLSGDDHTFIDVGDWSFRVSAGSSFPPNTEIAAQMAAHLVENLPPEVETAFDLFCGSGLFSAFLAPHFKYLVGIEASPLACLDYQVNLDEFDHVALYEARVEDALLEIDILPDLILTNPPPSGMGRKNIEALIKLNAPHLIYVSHDPGSLGREVKQLIEGGYKIRHATPFDMFPQTHHIESMSFFSR